LRNHLLCFSLACRGGEEGVAAGVAPHACRSQPLPERCYEAATALESLHALLSGVLQQRTEAGGYLRLAYAHHGRKATLLDLASMVYLPPGFKPTQRIFGSCCCALSSGAGPSGSSPVPVFLARRRSSALDDGEGSRRPDCFLSFCPEGLVVIPGVFSADPSLSVDSLVTCSSSPYK
jgi:hypothetical protein